MTLSPQVNKHFLLPGNIFAHPGEHQVMTVLGSCVAVCLWDQCAGIGGINHFMLPLWNGEGLPTPKYGNIAIEKLLQRMIDMGGKMEHLVAKVFGGANVLTSGKGMFAIGDRNIMLAEEMLQQNRIPIVGFEAGGFSGRRLIFNTRTGVVMVRRTSDISR